MATWREQYQIVKGYRIREGDNKTFDCPFCGASKKFTVGMKDGTLLWNCYKASCPVTGSYRGERSWTAIKNRLTAKTAAVQRKRRVPVPAFLTGVEGHEEAVRYLDSVNALEALRTHLADILYSPVDNRVLFMMNGRTGAVGRALDSSLPKWKAYGETDGIFSCGRGPTAVVVEDAASACAVGILPEYTGVALLGTSASGAQRIQLKRYERAIIALDNDASKKAIALAQSVGGLVPVTVRFLLDDLKWLKPEDIRKVLSHES